MIFIGESLKKLYILCSLCKDIQAGSIFVQTRLSCLNDDCSAIIVGSSVHFSAVKNRSFDFVYSMLNRVT